MGTVGAAVPTAGFASPCPSPVELLAHVGLTPGTSFGVSAGMVGAMVGCFYLFWPLGRGRPTLAASTARDNPAVVRYRMGVMSAWACGAPLALFGTMREGWGRLPGDDSPWVRPNVGAAAAALGFRTGLPAVRAAGVGLGLTLALFGPAAAWKAQQAQTKAAGGPKVVSSPPTSFLRWLWARYVTQVWEGELGLLWTVRTHVVAPVTEEVIFRACLLPVLLAGGFSGFGASVASTSIFAAAHIHHVATRLHHAGESVRASIAAIALMVGYTSVFSAYACALYLRTGSVLCPVVAHTVCNWVGLPPFGAMFSGPHRHTWLALQVAGIVLFAAAFAPSTDPKWHGSPFL